MARRSGRRGIIAAGVVALLVLVFIFVEFRSSSTARRPEDELVIFVSECHHFNDWQSVAQFYSAVSPAAGRGRATENSNHQQRMCAVVFPPAIHHTALLWQRAWLSQVSRNTPEQLRLRSQQDLPVSPFHFKLVVSACIFPELRRPPNPQSRSGDQHTIARYSRAGVTSTVGMEHDAPCHLVRCRGRREGREGLTWSCNGDFFSPRPTRAPTRSTSRAPSRFRCTTFSSTTRRWRRLSSSQVCWCF